MFLWLFSCMGRSRAIWRGPTPALNACSNADESIDLDVEDFVADDGSEAGEWLAVEVRPEMPRHIVIANHMLSLRDLKSCGDV